MGRLALARLALLKDAVDEIDLDEMGGLFRRKGDGRRRGGCGDDRQACQNCDPRMTHCAFPPGGACSIPWDDKR
jgi:hypothetical protein